MCYIVKEETAALKEKKEKLTVVDKRGPWDEV